MRRRSRTLRRLEANTRKLLAEVGTFAEDYDSARVIAALGNLALAVLELQQAAIVLEVTERREEAR